MHKIKEGVFVGSQIHKLIEDEDYLHLLHFKENFVWVALQSVVTKKKTIETLEPEQ